MMLPTPEPTHRINGPAVLVLDHFDQVRGPKVLGTEDERVIIPGFFNLYTGATLSAGV